MTGYNMSEEFSVYRAESFGSDCVNFTCIIGGYYSDEQAKRATERVSRAEGIPLEELIVIKTTYSPIREVI
jgi:hypothetical protein